MCLKMYSNGITTGDNVATVIVPKKSSLVGVNFTINTTNAGAVGCSLWYQLSTMGTSTFVTNDVQGIIADWFTGNDKAINFNGNDAHSIQVAGIPFEAGNVIRLHRLAQVAPTTAYCSVNLLFV